VTGQVGFLPATHVARLLHGERPHITVQTCSMVGTGGEMYSLHQDQVVIELSPEHQDRMEPGLVLVRTGERQRGTVSLRYLSDI